MTLLEEIDPAYYKEFIYIDSHEKNACVHNPRRLYTALQMHHYSSGQNSQKAWKNGLPDKHILLACYKKLIMVNNEPYYGMLIT